MKGEVRIGVLADTHIPTAARSIPKQVLRGLEGVDMILHAGDIARMSVIESLGRIAEVCAVCGNMDPAEVRAALPATRVLQIAGRRIGLIHGSGAPGGLADRVQRTLARAEGGNFDIIVFGHSHQAAEDRHGNVLRFNSGSPTCRFTSPPSYGILKLGETVESIVIRLK